MPKEFPEPEGSQSQSQETKERKEHIEAFIAWRDQMRDEYENLSGQMNVLLDQSTAILQGPVSDESLARLEEIDRQVERVCRRLERIVTLQDAIEGEASLLWKKG